jgi:hypothetical protein
LRLDFYDCNVQVGPCSSPVTENPLTAREIMDRLEPMGIRRALVYHALSKELHPAEGNPAVLKEIEGMPLAACWVAMPDHTGEVPYPAAFIAQMKAAGAKAVRLYPGLHQWSLADWCAGRLLSAFESNQVPVFLEMNQTGYEQVASLLAAHPNLRLVLMQTSYRCDRFIYPLLERYDHLHIETSSYVVSGGIEAICSRFGARRLVFGTGMPYTEPGAAVSLVSYADIADSDKQLIASGNLEGLLSWS